MHRQDTVSLANNHEISECWNPHYHKSPFRKDSAKIFEKWYKKQYKKLDRKLIRAAPLCIFGGVQFSVYVLREQASGTYAVCPSCKNVVICGYGGNEEPSPDYCNKCQTKLDFNDYFQPVSYGDWIQKEYLVNPKCDPAVTIAETCAYIKEGISVSDLDAVIVVLKDENLLQTVSFIKDFRIRNDSIESEEIHKRLESQWTYINPYTLHFNVQITERGKIMLKARKIIKRKETSERIVYLLNNPRKLLELSLIIVAKTIAKSKQFK